MGRKKIQIQRITDERNRQVGASPSPRRSPPVGSLKGSASKQPISTPFWTNRCFYFFLFPKPSAEQMGFGWIPQTRRPAPLRGSGSSGPRPGVAPRLGAPRAVPV